MGTYANPILDGCHPDPSICRVGEDYYLVTSTFEHLPGLPVHRSRDLVTWEHVGHVIDRPSQIDYTGIAASKGLYAPTIRHHRGVFYVVCTHIPGENPPAQAGHFVVTATDPAGPWSDPIWWPALPGIDPSLTFDGDRVWLCGTALADDGLWEGQCDVWLTELDPDSLQPVGEVRTLWRGALRDAGWAEGPHLIARPGGGWVLVAAEGGTDRDHAVCVAYADDIEGPYVGDPGNPRLTHRHLGAAEPIQNVGHADLVEDEDGRWWAVMLATHVVDGVNSLRGRQTHLVPAVWEEDRLVIAPGEGRVGRLITADGVPDQGPRAERLDGGLVAHALDPAWNGVRWHPSEFVAPAPGGGIVLRATRDEPTSVGRTAFLGRRVPADDSTLTVRLALEPGEGDLRGGVLVRTMETALVEVSITRDGVVSLVSTDDGRATEVARTEADPSGVEIALDLHGHTLTVTVDGTALATLDVAHLATGRPGWFMGSWWGPLAVGDGTVQVLSAETTLTR